MGSTIARLERLRHDEAGSLTIFGLFIFVAMLIAGGLAVDLMRYETQRVRLQSTLDRGVLAAASLSQPKDAETVVRDYFVKAGLGSNLDRVSVAEGLNFRSVAAEASAPVETLFMSMLAFDEFVAPAAGKAEENRREVEISLVLDVSGSMDRNQRLPRLKVAAKEFVDAVMHSPGDRDLISISIIPFATQVVAGADLLSSFDVSSEHTASHCIDFPSTAFSSTGIAPGAALQRTGHFDGISGGSSPSNMVCQSAANRQILAFSNDPAALKTKIDSLSAQGNTSIDLGAKWGTFLLDPSSRAILSDRIRRGLADTDFEGRPLAYGAEQSMKVLIVMSDGANTAQPMLNGAYATGPSGVFRDPVSGKLSFRDTDPSRYWIEATKTWAPAPYISGAQPAVELSFQALWDLRPTKSYAATRARMDTDSAGTWERRVQMAVDTGAKNARTSSICRAARTAGVTVFTIGFEADSGGNATLRDCATSAAYFFDVNGLEISEAFAAISSTINQLRLSQ